MTKTLKIAAAALAASMFAGTAYASINPIEIDIAPEIAAPIAGTTYAQATFGATTVEEFEERLIRQSDDGTLGPQDVLRIRMFEDNLQSAQLTEEELTDQLKRQSDDGTLNEHDILRIRMQTAQATFGATTVEEFEERLLRQSDDGTLGPNDIMRIRMFEDSLSASVDSVTFDAVTFDAVTFDAVTFDAVTFNAPVEVAQWHPQAEALKDRLERQSDDGSLNERDYRQVRQLHQSLTS